MILVSIHKLQLVLCLITFLLKISFYFFIYVGSNVNRLTIKAVNPISSKILNALEFPQKTFTTAAVCVYPSRVTDAVSTLKKLSLVEEFPVAAGKLLIMELF